MDLQQFLKAFLVGSLMLWLASLRFCRHSYHSSIMSVQKYPYLSYFYQSQKIKDEQNQNWNLTNVMISTGILIRKVVKMIVTKLTMTTRIWRLAGQIWEQASLRVSVRGLLMCKTASLRYWPFNYDAHEFFLPWWRVNYSRSNNKGDTDYVNQYGYDSFGVVVLG